MSVREFLQEAEKRQVEEKHPDLADDVKVVFCVTCLAREIQTVACALLNVTMWWRLRRYWRLVIVTFGEDEFVVEHLTTHLCYAIDLGLVKICSGGTVGARLAAEGKHDGKPEWMPDKPSEVMPDGKARPDRRSMPMLKYWHASVAKNTSHEAAVHFFGTDVLLVNLDGDQIVPPNYVYHCAEFFSNHRKQPGLLVTCASVDQALTGRLGYRAEDFIMLGGYDEEDAAPCDSRSWGEQQGDKTNKKTHGPVNCGFALPNDLRNLSKKHDRGWAKVCKCDPEVIARFSDKGENKVWINVNNFVWKHVYGPRLLEQKWFRNRETMPNKKKNIGAWFVAVPPIRKPPPSEPEQNALSDVSTPGQSSTHSAQTPIAQIAQVPLPVANVQPGKEPLHVSVVVVCLADLWYLRNTDKTPLGHICFCLREHMPYVVVSFTLS